MVIQAVEDGECTIGRAILPYIGAYFSIFLTSYILYASNFINSITFLAMSQALTFSPVVIIPLIIYRANTELVDFLYTIPTTWFFALASWFLIYLIQYEFDLFTFTGHFLINFNIGYLISIIVFTAWNPIYETLRRSKLSKGLRSITIHLISAIVSTTIGTLIGGAISQVLSI